MKHPAIASPSGASRFVFHQTSRIDKMMFPHMGFLGSIYDCSTQTTTTPEELTARVGARASLLGQLNIGPGDRVVIAHGGSASFFVDLFAVWHCGAAAVCLNPGLTPSEFSNIFDFVKAKAVLGPESRSTEIEGSAPVFPKEQMGPETRIDALKPSGTLEDEALILFTSGTTGDPKGVVHTFRSLISRIALNHWHIGDQHLRKTLNVLPTHFGHGLIGNCLTPLLNGHDLILAPGATFGVAKDLSRIIDDLEVTFMSSVPSLWKMVTRFSSPDNTSLKRIHVGSAPLSADLWNLVIEWGKTRNVVNMYGITETANWIGGASAWEATPADGAIGTVWGGSMAVRDKEGRISAVGEGEIVVQTPSLMTGYLDRPDLTSAVLSSGWFSTGDIGTVDQNGYAHLTGRKKFEINRAGIKIHPEDIDLLLERNDSVTEACAFGLPDEITGEIVAVAICPSNPEIFDLVALKSWCRERIASEKVPGKWFVVDAIPKNDRGKINRDNVAKYCLSMPK
jgi:oxalate---CoA ligase